MPFIKVQSGIHAGSVFTLDEETVRIGRDKGLGIQLLDQGISRRHAEVVRVGEMWFIRDLGSRNGTYVNEEPVEHELLRPGDEVRIGSTLLRFVEGPVEEDDDPEPEPAPAEAEVPDLAAQTMTVDLRTDEDDVVDPPVESPASTAALDALIRLAEVMSDERERTGLLESLVDLAARAVEAEAAYVFVRRGGAREFTMEARTPRGEAARSVEEEPAISRGIIRRVVEEERPVLTAEAWLDERFQDSESIIARRIQSVICAPLRARGHLVGVLYLVRRTGAPDFDERDLELITTMGIQTGIALQGIELTRRRERTLTDAVRILVRIMEVRDPLVAGHTERVAAYAQAMARLLELPPAQRRRLVLAAYLHNIGRLSLGTEARQGPEAERLQLEETLDLVGRMQGMEDVIPIIRHVHERMDGSGLLGIPGQQIPFAARILALANAVDAEATFGRSEGWPGRDGDHPGQRLPVQEAFEQAVADDAFDDEVVDAFRSFLEEGGVPSKPILTEAEEEEEEASP